MPDEGEERGGGFDDLFEDLAKFFAPEDRSEGTGPRRRRDTGQGSAGEGADEAGGARGSAGQEPEEDILPADWLSDIEGLDLGEPAHGIDAPGGEQAVVSDAGRRGPPESPSETEPPAAHEKSPAPAPEGEPASAETRRTEREAPGGAELPVTEAESRREGALHPTAEMSEQDWSRLREVLGDELGERAGDEIGMPAAGRSAAESLFGYGDIEGEGASLAGDEEERHDLTLEDLKRAPPEYRHLPGPRETGDEADQDQRDALRDERGAFLGEREGVRDDFAGLGERPAVPESGDQEGWAPSTGVRRWGEAAASAGERWEEPGIAEVEAAADQMAEEFRTGLPPEDELLAGLKGSSQPRTVKVGQPESMTGPTWEEPGSQPLMGEPAAPMFAGRNMPMALLTAAVLAAAALISLAASRAAFAVVVGAVVLIGQAEVYAAMHRKGYQPATALGLVVGGLLLAAAYFKGEQAMLSFVVVGIVLSFLWYMVAAPKAREGMLTNIGVTMFGLIYVPLLAGFALLVLTQHSGRALTLAILGLTFLYDAAAFVVGSFWGSRALAPTISPKKSWEGLMAATIVTFAVSVAVLPSIHPLTVRWSIGLALVIAVFAPIGDLAESAMKRDLGVKDMGSILPGHGGIMDRIDSALFVLPAAFIFLRLIF